MLVTPWLVGAALRADAEGPAVWLGEVSLQVFWLVAYLVFQAASTWLKAAPVKRPRYRTPVIAYGILAAAQGLGTLVALGPGALGWVPGFVPLLAVAWWLAWRRRERSLLGGVVTVAAASLLGLVARHPVPHVPDAATLVAVAACFGYFAGTVLYVKTMIRERGKPAWLAASVGFHAAATVVCLAGLMAGGVASLAPLAAFFAATTVRALAMPLLARRVPISPKTVGFAEIGFTAALVLACLVPSL